MTDRARRLVARACPVCEWQGSAVEIGLQTPDCPWCHAPTTIVSAELLADPRAASKNPHAAALGRLGGLKGGPARAERLSARRRREIAKKAAEARWHRHGRS